MQSAHTKHGIVRSCNLIKKQQTPKSWFPRIACLFRCLKPELSKVEVSSYNDHSSYRNFGGILPWQKHVRMGVPGWRNSIAKARSHEKAENGGAQRRVRAQWHKALLVMLPSLGFIFKLSLHWRSCLGLSWKVKVAGTGGRGGRGRGRGRGRGVACSCHEGWVPCSPLGRGRTWKCSFPLRLIQWRLLKSHQGDIVIMHVPGVTGNHLHLLLRVCKSWQF